MTKASLLLVALGLVALASAAAAQRSGPSMAALVNLLRFQNTACHNDQDESGTCLSDNECSRRAGINIGTCANGYGSCCSFKVSVKRCLCVAKWHLAASPVGITYQRAPIDHHQQPT